MPTEQDVDDILDEVWRIVDSAQASGWSDAPTRSALGSIKDYTDQMRALVHELVAPAPSPPPPVTRLVGPGQTKAFRLARGQVVTIRCPNKTTPCAVAFSLNGGALASDDPIPGQVDSDLVTSLGFVMVEATYDYSSAAAAYASVLAALQWTYKNVQAIGGDAARISGVGHSTGASFIALLQLRDDSPGFTQATFLWSTAATTAGPHGAGPEQQMVATKYQPSPDQWYPINWINAAKSAGKHVVVYQVHATDDSLVPYQEAEQFAQAGINAFIGNWHYHRTTGGHGATPAPICAQSQADLQSVDRS